MPLKRGDVDRIVGYGIFLCSGASDVSHPFAEDG